MQLQLIVAASENNVIGRRGELPWRLSADLRRFKRLTMGHCLIMGRKTYESIGRPLPGRVTIVLTRSASLGAPQGVLCAASLDEALALVADSGMSREAAFVVGGGEVYRAALPRADRIYFTRVHADIKGDATFPAVDWSRWTLAESERRAADDHNDFDFSFEVWDRAEKDG